MTELAIRCAGVHKHYGDVHALRGLDLEVRRGECFGLLGPNGAGKTTAIEIFEGLMPADSGVIEIFGGTWGAGRDQVIRERIGVQPQDSPFIESLTVYETVRVFRSFYREGRGVAEMIAAVELQDKQNARMDKLSGGQKQRTALACALVGTPDLLFLDEPTTGLDPQSRRRLWQLVENFRADGGTVLITTHYMEEASRLCDRVAIVDHGAVIALGTPDQLIASLEADQFLSVSLAVPSEASPDGLERGLGALSGVRTCRRDESPDDEELGYIMAVSDITVTMPALLGLLDELDIGLTSMTTHQPTLEDVFVAHTGRGLRDD